MPETPKPLSNEEQDEMLAILRNQDAVLGLPLVERLGVTLAALLRRLEEAERREGALRMMYQEETGDSGTDIDAILVDYLKVMHLEAHSPEAGNAPCEHCGEELCLGEFDPSDTLYGRPTMSGNEDLRAALEGRDTNGKRLSAHLVETAAVPWLMTDGRPFVFESIEECEQSWRSLLEHEAIEVEALEGAFEIALSRLEAAEKALRIADVHVGWGDCTLENVHNIIRAALARSPEEEKP